MSSESLVPFMYILSKKIRKKSKLITSPNTHYLKRKLVEIKTTAILLSDI